jgi:hypothetical protein
VRALVLLLLAGCGQAPARDAPKSQCSALLQPLPPNPVSPHVLELIWRDESTVLALLSEGDGPEQSCGASEIPERSGFMVFDVNGHGVRAYRGLRASHASFLTQNDVLFADPRLGVGTLDLRNGCYRDAGIPPPLHIAIDRTRGKLYATHRFELARYDTRTFVREAHRPFPKGFAAIAFDPTTRSLAVYTHEKNNALLVVLDGDTLEERGSLAIPRALSSTSALWVRPEHGQLAVAFHTPCTRFRHGNTHAMHMPKCLAGLHTGALLIDLANLKELKREDLNGIGERGMWTSDGKSLVVECGGAYCSWTPGEKPKQLKARYGYRFTIGPSGDRVAMQHNTYQLGVASLAGGDPIWQKSLPSEPRPPKKYCD